MEKIEDIIRNTNDKSVDKINWTKAWSSKYPILGTYQDIVDVSKYGKQLREMLEDIEHTYHFSKLDSMLVLKDILAQEWKKYK